jgi:hypothetical protein
MLVVEDVPVLSAERVNAVQLKIHCEYCNKAHYHGLGDGHRVAHCLDESSLYLRTGYIIQEIKKPVH